MKISTITATYTRHLENIVIEFKNVNDLQPCTFEGGFCYVVLGTEKELRSNIFPYVHGNKLFLQLKDNKLHDENDEQEQQVNRNVAPVEEQVEEPALQSDEDEVDFSEAEPEETEEELNARLAGLFQDIDLTAEEEEQKFVAFT